MHITPSTNHSIFLLLLLPILLLSIKPAIPATVILVAPINFGTIIASPFLEEIVINAQTGPAVPFVATGGYSMLDGSGFSGIIRITSDMGGQSYFLTYPASVTLSAAAPDTLVLDEINLRSKTTAVSTTAGEVIDFNVGGKLHIKTGQVGDNYSVTMSVNFNIINP